ncbi:MAG: porin [Pseudomonadota bacterium]
MKKHLIAMAVASAVVVPTAASADTILYGKIHASYDFWGGDNGDANDDGRADTGFSNNEPVPSSAGDENYSLSSNSSRIGIKGKEDISESLSLIYQWETTVDWGGNGAGIGDSPRNTYIGFTGDWGTAIAGRHDTPFKKVGRKYDLFGDTVADARAITRMKNELLREDGATWASAQVGDDWDRRTNNTVAYVTPDFAGFTASLAYVSDWDNDLNNEKDAYSLSAGYEIGGFMIDAAYEVHNTAGSTDPDITDDSSAYRVGAGYGMGGFKVVGLYQSISDLGMMSGADVDMYGLGGAYSFGDSTFKAQYYERDDIDGYADTDASMWAVGYDYKLSRQTSVYAVYASMGAGDNVASTLVNGGHGEAPTFERTDADGNGTVFGVDSSAFSVGVVHKF